MLGLGNSIGTPDDGHRRRTARSCTASRSSRPRARRGARGRSSCSTCRSPTTARPCASDRPARRGSAALGAVAMLVRSVGTRRAAHAAYRLAAPTPRTAEDSGRRDADRRRRAPAAHGRPRQPVRLKLMMEAHFLPDADSANVVGEIRGRELPNEFVVVGGHLDSWDVGTGATDDGGGVVVTLGSAADHEEAEPAAAAHRPRGAVDERRKRRSRRPGLSRRHRGNWPTRHDAGVRHRRVPADRLRLHRQRRGARDDEGASPRCSAASTPTRSARPAAAPTSVRASRRRSIPAWRSRSTATIS